MLILAIQPPKRPLPINDPDLILHEAEDIAEGLSIARHENYEAILLDEKACSGKTTEGAARYLRSSGIIMPLIVLATTSDETVETAALNAGADDYIILPSDRLKLKARINAVVRRSQGLASDVVTIGKLSLDMIQQQATWDGDKIHFSPQEFKVLCLMARKKRPVKIGEFITQLSNGMVDPSEDVIRKHMSHIRNKLREFPGGENYIRSGYKTGYAFNEPMLPLGRPEPKPFGTHP